jgi:hypothetical protein
VSEPMPMPAPISAEADWDHEVPVRELWRAAVGKVFKLTSKPYGVRNVTYTHVKSVRDTGSDGDFEIEVVCVEIIARVIDGKRTHSNICKEGILPQDAASRLQPADFGMECPLAEFEKVTGAILAYTNTYLEWVMQEQPEEQTEIGIPVDLPHLQLTDMEASLVRNSPFLVKDLYILTPNSVAAARVSIRQEMQRAWRNMMLADAVDPVYVERKNEAATSLGAKLNAVQREANGRPDAAGPALKLDSLCLALLGQPSATSICWVTANPSEDGAIYRLGMACGPLDFVRWAHVSGRPVPPATTEGKQLKDYFAGWNQNYTGPDADGIYPLLKPATD